MSQVEKHFCYQGTTIIASFGDAIQYDWRSTGTCTVQVDILQYCRYNIGSKAQLAGTIQVARYSAAGTIQVARYSTSGTKQVARYSTAGKIQVARYNAAGKNRQLSTVLQVR